ncbi:MAG TPA: hypothetical protein VHC90_07055 [Bryobacteraceae bacterium]|nr:hypothetical protein [Bryobacteraceae bacterium]
MAETPIGIVYNTPMSRPDAALALAAMYLMEDKRESHMGSVCVVGAGLNAAIFCDIVSHVYMFGPPRNGNQALAVGLAIEQGVSDSAMVKTAVDRKNEKGEPMYARTIQKATDTSAPAAVLRNGVIFNAESAVILSGPATYLARSLDLLGTKDLYKDRVKRLVIVDAGTTYNDAAALRKVIAEWPSPVFFLPKETGDALRFPGSDLDKDFAWNPAHPVVDAYKSYKPMPFDAPLYDVAAAHFAVHPDSGFFEESAGSIAVADDGAMKFTPGSGAVKSLGIVTPKKAALMAALIATATEKPLPPVNGRAGGRPGRGAFGASGARGGRGASGAPGK